MKHMLDLYSGLGGASEAFVSDPGWSVLRIENNPLLGGVPYTIIDDVKNIADNIFGPQNIKQKIDLIWASPPCREFSDGFNSPKSQAARAGTLVDYEPDMDLLFAALRIIEIVKPKYWIIENVKGSIRYFSEHLGHPTLIVGPYVLWGNFPLFEVDPRSFPTKAEKDVWSSDPLRVNHKAKIPLELSLALLNAIEQQRCILDY